MNCRICGVKLGSYLAFALPVGSILIGQADEPPVHRKCAVDIARRTAQVVPVWITKDPRAGLKHNNLFPLCEPEEVIWMNGHRLAVHDEAQDALDIAIATVAVLQKTAKDNLTLAVQVKEAMELLPQNRVISA